MLGITMTERSTDFNIAVLLFGLAIMVAQQFSGYFANKKLHRYNFYHEKIMEVKKQRENAEENARL